MGTNTANLAEAAPDPDLYTHLLELKLAQRHQLAPPPPYPRPVKPHDWTKPRPPHKPRWYDPDPRPRRTRVNLTHPRRKTHYPDIPPFQEPN